MDRVIAERKFTKKIDGGKTKVEIKAQLHDLGQGPYFSMTFDEYEARGGRWRWCSGGAGVEQYREHFPEVRKYAKWHLVSVERGPMHYIANALYWAGCSGWCDGAKNSPPHWDNLMSTIVWGGAPTDIRDYEAFSQAFYQRDAVKLKALLNARFDGLMATFDAAMNELFGEGTITAE